MTSNEIKQFLSLEFPQRVFYSILQEKKIQGQINLQNAMHRPQVQFFNIINSMENLEVKKPGSHLCLADS